jgi:hypothetical protein
MTNQEINKYFLIKTDDKTRKAVLENIANHYGCTLQEAFVEVTDSESEHLLDYITGPMRPAVQVLMQRHGLSWATA